MSVPGALWRASGAWQKRNKNLTAWPFTTPSLWIKNKQWPRLNCQNYSAVKKNGEGKKQRYPRVKKSIDGEDQSISFIQKYEAKIRHFGMLSRWNDSQHFLSEYPDLVSEETAKYLLLWCSHLESEQKTALMEQVAHQAVVMQFIIEMAKSCNVDPRGCFRLFFQKAKEEKEGYFEAFKSELEILKSKVRQHAECQRYEAAILRKPAFPPDLGHMGTQQCHQKDVLQSHPNAAVCHLNPMEHAEDEDLKMMDTL
ncbi:hsp90 co-chaperone Cdc37-like 1 isoform X4 [Xenopus tropicalis]|uniref:Hsp90 co-chaperone Cdc37-like 1 n=1 Tax=Xenopus tropicalis TaxID=8364 RepID=A0A8J0SPV8_XENTR|nr:hsp90 co-chaperone Cdc37-like 1 isoform X4 [Xenopus tropicalis]|eukprot:XP_012819498.1 PREDICTED: hsp90 co-chaperone Cdc37-like 1 isoform X4 [Xenopus tropicalis]